MTTADWYPDPSGRHQHRYWDGRTWTASVADQGTTASDPPALSPPERSGAADWHPDPSGRHQHRYWDGRAWTTNVADNGVTGHDPAELPAPDPAPAARQPPEPAAPPKQNGSLTGASAPSSLAPPTTDGGDEIQAAERRVAASLEVVRTMLTSAGLKFVEATPCFMGQGVGVAWSETFYAMVSVANFLDQQVNITYGILRDISRDRMKALECCNLHNQNVAAYPVYLHDAEDGWDILQQNVLPLQILRDAPQFVVGFYLGGSPQIVNELRGKAAEHQLGGQPYQWNPQDMDRLLLKSLI